MKTIIYLPVIWYIACADWLVRKSMSDAYVTLPLNVWGYPYKSGENIKFVLIFILVTSHVMLGIYQSLKTSWCGVSRVGGGAPR